MSAPPLGCHLDPILDVLCRGPHTAFPRHRALALGLGDDDLTRLVRNHTLDRLTYGWYARHDPHPDPRSSHRRRAFALVNRIEDAVLSHHSALLDLDLPAFGADLSTVHLTHRSSPSHRRRTGYVVHCADHSTRDLPPRAAAVRCADAVVQAGLRHPLTALVAADQALRRDLTTRSELDAALEAHRNRPGARATAAILSEVDPRAESPAETLARHALHTVGVDAVPQVIVEVEGRTFRVDLLAGRLVIEVDGVSKYLPSGREFVDERSVAEVIRAEKAREAALVRAGLVVVRLTWPEMVGRDGRIRYDNVDRMVRTLLRP